MIFDPIALTEAVTPSAVQSKLRQREWGVALRMSLHLNETGLIRNVVEDTPHESIGDSARCAGHGEALERLLQFCAAEMSDSVHVEFYLRWCLELLRAHGAHVEKHRGTFLRALRAMHRAVAARYDEVKRVCDENGYTLDFLEDQANLILNR
uniref:Small-subunit processome Utp12 domain-containing protein n=2 Tax=Odontella aurita TaxID=265563 RepID=A0A7S4JNT4_9STRA|mmetsp:Transcript_50478/g.152022  ORF Transcript_50478/g.152022 Transcript_50478/m.152022 type:complete len:152 (+) Transcript_50478:338-793(+)